MIATSIPFFPQVAKVGKTLPTSATDIFKNNQMNIHGNLFPHLFHIRDIL
jgi:hypothetical protein